MVEVVRSYASAPLSEAQRGIWLGHTINTNAALYNAGEIIELHGVLDRGRLVAAINQACAEATVLNLRFVEQADGKIVQMLPAAAAGQLHGSEVMVLDYRAQPDALATAFDWFRAHLSIAIDLAREPCYSNTLIVLSEQHVLWCMKIHHIACDGYGFALLQQRVVDLYNRQAVRPFADYWQAIAKEREYCGSAREERDRVYWHSAVNQVQSPVSFTHKKIPLESTPIQQQRILTADDFAFVKLLAGQFCCQWSDVLIALVAGLLVKKTAAAELTLGMPVMNRMGTAFVNTPAMTMNIIALPLDLSDTLTWRQLCQSIRDGIKQSRPHLRYRYESLKRDLNSVAGDKKLFGPVVNIMPFERPLGFDGVDAVLHPISSGPVEDIGFSFVAAPGGKMLLRVEANPGHYQQDAVKEIIDGVLAELLDLKQAQAAGLLDDCSLAVDKTTLSVVSGEALAVASGAELPVNPIFQSLYAAAWKKTHGLAIHDLSAGSRFPAELDYVALVEQVEILASGLRNLGVMKYDVVALKLSRGKDAIISCLAIWHVGACFVFLDPLGAESRNDWILQDADPKLVLTPEDVRSMLSKHSDALGVLPNTIPAVCAESLAYIIYTSGSTGRPKGVKISHAALSDFILGADQVYGPGSEDRVLQFAPMHFDTCIEEIFLALYKGATLVVRHADMTQSIPGFLRALAELKISWLDLPTAYWHELVFHCHHRRAPLPETVATVIIGGEAALPERIEQWHGIPQLTAKLVNTYGPSETTVVATAHVMTNGVDDSSIGRPLPGRHVAIVGEQNQWLPQGQLGELMVFGGGVGEGYVSSAGKFAHLSSLISSQFGADQPLRCYRTGDLARINERGRIEFKGRIDEEIKISGQRIHPREIESALVSIQGVSQAAVVVFKQGAYNMLAAFAVLCGGDTALDEQAIRQALSGKLPASMVPTIVRVVSEFPKTPSGKLDKKALSAALERDLNAGDCALGRPECNAVQAAIMEEWRQVLGPIDIALDQDFFMLGGESLQTIKVVNRLGARLNRDIPVALLFQHPTVAAFAEAIDAIGEDKGCNALPDSDSDADRHRNRVMQDSLLSESDLPRIEPISSQAKPEVVLLTGASGFVGAHCLHALLADPEVRVVCLLRGNQGVAKLKTAFERYRLPFDPGLLQTRVRFVQSDLEQEQLGLDSPSFVALAQSVDSIVHNAASTSVLRDYRSLKAVNLDSTRSLLRMLAINPVPFHYVSTIAVSQSMDETFVDYHGGLRDGYQQTKWASERLVQQASERGYHANLYRLARVVGPLSSAYVNEKDLVWQIVRSSIRHKRFPEWPIQEPWTAVDTLAAAISCNVMSPAVYGVVNFLPTENVRLASIHRWLTAADYELELVNLGEWHQTIAASHEPEDLALASFFDRLGCQPEQATPDYDVATDVSSQAANGRDLLRRAGCGFIDITAEHFQRYLQHCIDRGLIPSSETPAESVMVRA